MPWRFALCLALAASLFLIGTLAAPPDRTTARWAVLAGPSGPEVAEAIIRRRTITPEVDTGLPIRTDGRHVSVSGAFACDPGENWEVTTELTQGGSRGGGRSQGVCRGDVQEWVVRAVAEGSGIFEPGEARGCAVLRTLRDTAETDRHEWCNDVVLTSAAGGGTDDEAEGLVSWVALGVGALAVLVALVALVRPRQAS
ncbi:MAG: hypothetical protein M3314_04965 [Actinomycetota bacterium]|nr:hypothetical protein [Actinomycetota bacterium]